MISFLSSSIQRAPVICYDAKINFDDNAKFRQKDLFASEDIAEKNPREVEAEKHNLNYIGMDGNIACIGKILTFKSVHLENSGWSEI